MPTLSTKRPRVVPGFRPCAACDEPMDLNAVYSFVVGVQCICVGCYSIGFRFDADGSVVLEREEQVA